MAHPAESDDVRRATEPARWLLDAAGDGTPLTPSGALSRAVARNGASSFNRRIGMPRSIEFEVHRELDAPWLHALHAGLRRLRLLRRTGKQLVTTARGRQLADDPTALLALLATNLGGGDGLGTHVADALVAALRRGERLEYGAVIDSAVRVAASHGWRHADDHSPLTARDLQSLVADLRWRGVAYGLIEAHELGECGPQVLFSTRCTELGLTPAGMQVLGSQRRVEATDGQPQAYVFDARWVGHLGGRIQGVSAVVIVAGDHPLTTLRDPIGTAFNWYDDHLYSFWLDNRFWGADETEYTSPHTLDSDAHAATVLVRDLGLQPGAKIAYVFDFGDELRVRLPLTAITHADHEPYPRVVSRRGTPPAQYGPPS